jgi:hypothetical protein
VRLAKGQRLIVGSQLITAFEERPTGHHTSVLALFNTYLALGQ